jgi:hypothetical protein
LVVVIKWLFAAVSSDVRTDKQFPVVAMCVCTICVLWVRWYDGTLIGTTSGTLIDGTQQILCRRQKVKTQNII